MSLRGRLITLAVVLALAVAGTVTYLVSSRAHETNSIASQQAVVQTSLAAVQNDPRIYFRSTVLNDHYGDTSVVALGDPGGPRAFTSIACDRVYATQARLLCLSTDAGIVTRYAARVYDTKSHGTVATLPLTGIPSRARLSPDGSLAASTSFTAGDSYAGTAFSTRTVISEIGGGVIGGLEDFSLVHDGVKIKPIDRNYWGVTFAPDDNTFFATVKFSGHTWLVRGNIAQRTVTTVVEDAECPSLSPDGVHLVFKRRGSLPPGQWRLTGYTLATGSVVPLAETRNVDDQVAWLDADHVMYGLHRSGTQAATSDVWSVPADGTGTPTLLIPQAWSPSLVP